MSEVLQQDIHEVTAIAQAKGLVAITPHLNELLIDIDQPFKEGKKFYNQEVMGVLLRNEAHLEVVSILYTKSSNGRTHLYIRVDKSLSPAMRIALQACLGSDPIREVLSAIQILNGSEPDAVTALFETQKEARKVLNWREGR